MAIQDQTRTSARAEEIFFAWLMRLSHQSPVALAAQQEIDRLDRAGPPDAETRRLRNLFAQVLMPPAASGRSGRRLRQ